MVRLTAALLGYIHTFAHKYGGKIGGKLNTAVTLVNKMMWGLSQMIFNMGV